MQRHRENTTSKPRDAWEAWDGLALITLRRRALPGPLGFRLPFARL